MTTTPIDDDTHYNEFMTFYGTVWLPNVVCTTSDFTDRFSINRHLARYYLFDRLTRKEGLLFRVMYYNKAYYLYKSPENLKRMKRFVWIGVKVEEH